MPEPVQLPTFNHVLPIDELRVGQAVQDVITGEMRAVTNVQGKRIWLAKEFPANVSWSTAAPAVSVPWDEAMVGVEYEWVQRDAF